MTADRLNKLKFRAWRRGFREADLILGPFADRNLAGFDAAELDLFEAMLNEQDHDLYNWISGKEAAPAQFEGPLLERLREFQRNLPIASGDVSGV
jgi:antitoxin CptB